RLLAETGTGLLRGADAAAESILPGPAMLIPGSTLGTAVRNKQARDQAMQTAQLNEKPELAELQGEIKGELEGQKDTAAQKRTETQQAGATQRTEATQQGAADRQKTGIIAKADLQQMEDANKAAIAAGKPQPTKIKMVGGAAHIMERDPATGEYSIDRGEAPPTYAQIAPSLRTIDVIDPTTGMPTIETLSGKPLGVSATGAYGHEMAQAGAVNRAGNDLITQLEDPTNRAILGQLSSYIKQGTLGTPLADARAAKMSAQLKTFAALQP